jgi:hypothetical protein
MCSVVNWVNNLARTPGNILGHAAGTLLMTPRTILHAPDNKSRNIPEVVLVRRWAVAVLGIWREGVGWVKGGANGVSLQAT